MYENELGQVIMASSNVMNIKLYYHLTKMKQFEGGIIASRSFIAEEMNMTKQYMNCAFKWLIDNNFITERKFQGQTQFILNHVVSKNPAEKPSEPAEKIEKQENNQPKPTVIRKGGKTITRMEIPDF